jgi:hypothetical protein
MTSLGLPFANQGVQLPRAAPLLAAVLLQLLTQICNAVHQCLSVTCILRYISTLQQLQVALQL